MYRTIYVPVDNSEHSNRAIEIAIELGRRSRAALVGCHVYAARLHDYRFKQMEFTLPEEYLEENELERQRRIHDSLITMGLQLITDSYLDVMQQRCEAADVPFERKMFDGKHYTVIADDIAASGYGLVIIGALGMGAVKESVIGSVCERVMRRIATDALVVHDTTPLGKQLAGGGILVAIDGSARGFAALQTAMEIGHLMDSPVQVATVTETFPDEANREARAAGQKAISQSLLERAVALTAVSASVEPSVDQQAPTPAPDLESNSVRTMLLEGKPFEQILRCADQQQPWLLVLGRNGAGTDDDSMELGSCAENVLRLASCNVLLCAGTGAEPSRPRPRRAETSEALGPT